MKKRPDGRYQISALIGRNDNGSPKRKVVYGNTQREVKEKANDLRTKYNMGLDIDSNITVGEWDLQWLKVYKCGLEYKTLEMYNSIVKNYIVKPIGNIRLNKLKTIHIQNIVNENSDKSWIVKKFKLTINQILEQAVINDIIFRNPAIGVKLPPLEKKHTKRALSEQEEKAIKSLELDEKTKCFVYLLMYTGMRKSEALSLTINDIDKCKMLITVCKTLVFKVNQSDVKDTTKTSAGVRSIPIFEPLKDVLFNYVDSLDTEYLFTTSSGKTFSDTVYRRMWGKFEKAMGTKNITAHIFRHNFATMLYNAGVDIKEAQSILGHKSVQVTMDIYTHLSTQKRDEATKKMNAFLS